MKIDIKKEKKEVHVTVEAPLYNGAKSSGESYYPHSIKLGTPKVIRMLKDEGIEVDAARKTAVLDNRSEQSRIATWVFELKNPAPAPRAAKKASTRRR